MPSLWRALVVLGIAVFTSQFADGINRSLQNNFFVEVLHIRPDQMGLWTSLRELPGLLVVFVAAVGMRLSPPWLGALALLVNGLGYGGYGFVYGFGGLVFTSVVGSVGFHLWMPIMSALGLSLSQKENAGRLMGRLQGVGFAGVLLSMGLMFALVKIVDYRPAFIASGLVLLVGAVAMTRFPVGAASWPRQRLVVRRRYLLYYVMSLLEGSRFQVFLAFAAFLLVREYGVDVQTMTLLFVVSSLVSVCLAPIVGAWIDRVGEKRSLTVNYVANLLIFVGLALVQNREVAMALYVLYNFLMLFFVALNTYLKQIAEPADLGPSLALGITSMHIPSVVVPLAGGLLWERVGYQVPFLMAAAFVVGSLVAAQFIPAREVPAQVAERAAI